MPILRTPEHNTYTQNVPNVPMILALLRTPEHNTYTQNTRIQYLHSEHQNTKPILRTLEYNTYTQKLEHNTHTQNTRIQYLYSKHQGTLPTLKTPGHNTYTQNVLEYNTYNRMYSNTIYTTECSRIQYMHCCWW